MYKIKIFNIFFYIYKKIYMYSINIVYGTEFFKGMLKLFNWTNNC